MNNDNVTCRTIARERVHKHGSMKVDSWKLAHRCVISRYVHGYRIKETDLRLRGHGYAI
jgi:hypothetical protein